MFPRLFKGQLVFNQLDQVVTATQPVAITKQAVVTTQAEIKFGIIGVWLLVAFGFAMPSWAVATQPIAPALATQVLAKGSLIETLELDGVIEAVQQTTVAAQTSGQVRKVYFDVDDAVAPGELLVELDATEQQARYQQAQAGLQEAQAGLEDARQNFTRIEGIYKRQLASTAQLDQARNQLDAATARQQRALASVAEAKQQLDYTRIVAPYGGIMTARHVEVGSIVNPGQPLMTGVSLEELRVVAALPQSYAASARTKREAKVSLGSDRILATSAMTFYPYADPNTHTFRLRLQLDNPAADLFPGMLVKVSLPIAERSAIWIPTSALIERGELKAVYVLNQQQQPRLRQIRLGKREMQGATSRVEVLAGLEEGEHLVLDPMAALASLEAQND